jgi:hypothetical protein
MPLEYNTHTLERSDTVATQVELLRTMHNIRLSGDARPMYNLDETRLTINPYNTYGKSKSSVELKVEPEKGSRITVCHA